MNNLMFICDNIVINNNNDVDIYRYTTKENENYIILSSNFEEAKKQFIEQVGDYQLLETLKKCRYFNTKDFIFTREKK